MTLTSFRNLKSQTLTPRTSYALELMRCLRIRQRCPNYTLISSHGLQHLGRIRDESLATTVGPELYSVLVTVKIQDAGQRRSPLYRVLVWPFCNMQKSRTTSQKDAVSAECHRVYCVPRQIIHRVSMCAELKRTPTVVQSGLLIHPSNLCGPLENAI